MKMLIRQLLAGCLLVAPVAARPFTVDDMLHAERFSDVAVDPSGRWLVFGEERPLNEASRFDPDAMAVLRSRLFRVDLKHPAAATPLADDQPGAGVVAYGFSPAGSRLAVARLWGTKWQLGVVDMASGRTRWLDIGPADEPGTATLAWVSEDALLVIAAPEGLTAWGLGLGARMKADLAARWQATATGLTAVTVVGSGALAATPPAAPDKRLLLIDVARGGERELATGSLESIWPSPDRRHALLLTRAGPIRPNAGALLAVGTAPRHRRVAIIDLQTGAQHALLPGWDVPTSAPAWSGKGDAVLLWARRDAEDWSEAHPWRISADGADAETLGMGRLHPVVAGLPDEPPRLALGWRGSTPLAYAQPSETTGKSNWYALDTRISCLTCDLPTRSMDLIAAPGGDPIMTSGDGAWRFTRRGTVPLLAGMDGMLAGSPSVGGADPGGSATIGWRRTAGGMFLTVAGRSGEQEIELTRGRIKPVAASLSTGWMVARRPGPTGETSLVLVRPRHAEIVVATINKSFFGLDPVRTVPVSHRRPDDTLACSWLYLPTRQGGGPKPPLIVIPYPGRRLDGDTPDPSSLYANVMALVGHGYAVLLPDVPAAHAGSDGVYPFTAQVLAAVDATIALGDVDPHRLGLWGHSFGALTAAIIASQTDRFQAIVAANGIYDLASRLGTFAPWTRVDPQDGQSMVPVAGWAETGQAKLGATPWASPARYVAASPVFYADRIHTPMLIVAGDSDAASPLQQSEELFSALYRQGKDAELLTYWGEGHVFMSPGNVRDFYARLFAWFDTHFTESPGKRRDTAAD